jgi:hypothetical protein
MRRVTFLSLAEKRKDYADLSWVRDEQCAMHSAVNDERAKLGKGPVDLAASGPRHAPWVTATTAASWRFTVRNL